MKTFRASINIEADPSVIWDVLTTADTYPEWDPGMDRLEGTIALGEKIVAYTKLSPERAFPVKVTRFEPNNKMVWSGGMPLGLFKGVRTFCLSQEGESTRVIVEESFSGILLPIFGKMIPDLNPVFEAFLVGLKARSEQLVAA